MDQKFFPISEFVMTQFNMKQGLRRSCQNSVRAINKKVRQIFIMDALEIDKLKEHSREDRRSGMAYLMFQR